MKNLLPRKQKSITILLSLLLLSACSSNNLPTMPDLGISTDEFNTYFNLMTEEGMNTFKTDDIVRVSIEVTGDEAVSFSYDEFNKGRDIALFILRDEQWVAVDNLMNYPEGYLVYWPANGDPLKLGTVSVWPVLSDTNQDVLLRVILMGKIFKNDQITDERVIGYVDVKLKP